MMMLGQGKGWFMAFFQVWNPENPEEEVLAMVSRTGMHTALGVMIRQLVTPTSKLKEKDPSLPVTSLRSCLC